MVSLKFHCQDVKKDFITIDLTPNKKGLFIVIVEENNNSIINLDKSTAIKLSKELRKQIALLD